VCNITEKEIHTYHKRALRNGNRHKINNKTPQTNKTAHKNRNQQKDKKTKQAKRNKQTKRSEIRSAAQKKIDGEK
jgi:hypothetical protein